MRSLWKSKLITPAKKAIYYKITKIRENKDLNVFSQVRLHQFFVKTCLVQLKQFFSLSLFFVGWFFNLKLLLRTNKVLQVKTHLFFWNRDFFVVPLLKLPIRKLNVYNGLRYQTYTCDLSKLFFKIRNFVPCTYLGLNKFILKNKKPVLSKSLVTKKKT